MHVGPVHYRPRCGRSIQSLDVMAAPLQIDEWADAYIRVHDAGAGLDENHPDYLAAYEFLDELTGPRAEECWLGILAVVARRPSEKVLGMLAAGPVEDLLECSGDRFIDRIELQASRDPVFRRMLHGAWKSGSDDTWARVVEARGPEDAV
jgi:hypothetical protein